MIVIEVLDHLGRVKGHHKLSGGHIKVGRGYDNDLVLNDPFVCGHHLQLEVCDDGSLVAHDLNSLNGLYPQGRKERVESLVLQPDERLRIGHTTLRYRSVNHEVAPARQDRLRFEFINDLLNSHWVQWGTYLALGLLIVLFAYLDSFNEFEPIKVVQSHILPVAIALLIWAGFWAVLSRLTTHRFFFTAHSIIAVAMMLLTLLYEEFLAPTLRFAFNAEVTIDLLTTAVTFIIMMVAFYGHLRFVSSQSTRRLALTAFALSAVIMGLSYIGEYSGSDAFTNYPDYHQVMMPPEYQVVSDATLDEFLQQAEGVKTALEQQVQQDGE